MTALTANTHQHRTPAHLGQHLKSTSALLIGGVIAGPIYIGLALIQALTRPGFDITRHDVSILSNGSLGWIQIANFILSGLLTIAGAVGITRAMSFGRGKTWGPLLIGIYGLGLIGAGVFVADPALGFPPGTPATANAVSWHGSLHLLCAAIGFSALIAATFVFARRYAGLGHSGWSRYSGATGAIFLVSFLGVIMGRPLAIASGLMAIWTVSVLGLWAGVALAWAWISATAARGATLR